MVNVHSMKNWQLPPGNLAKEKKKYIFFWLCVMLIFLAKIAKKNSQRITIMHMYFSLVLVPGCAHVLNHRTVFLQYTQAAARELGVRGWCRNTRSDTVQGHLEALQEPITKMSVVTHFILFIRDHKNNMWIDNALVAGSTLQTKLLIKMKNYLLSYLIWCWPRLEKFKNLQHFQ